MLTGLFCSSGYFYSLMVRTLYVSQLHSGSYMIAQVLLNY